MGFNPEIHHRRSIRLQGDDYSTEGAYFVTVCVRDGECLFGDAADGEMLLNDAGRMVLATWNELRTHYPRIHVDVHIVMPNHFHGIIFLVGAAPRGRPDFPAPHGRPSGEYPLENEFPQVTEGHPQGGARTAMPLFDAMHRFKSYSTARYRHALTNVVGRRFPADCGSAGITNESFAAKRN